MNVAPNHFRLASHFRNILANCDCAPLAKTGQSATSATTLVFWAARSMIASVPAPTLLFKCRKSVELRQLTKRVKSFKKEKEKKKHRPGTILGNWTKNRRWRSLCTI